MAEIKMVRVDDRLIHGQTIVAWVRQHPVDTLVVIDNPTASNPMLQKILKVAAPGYKVFILSIPDAIQKFQGGEIAGNCMVIFKSPVNAVPVWQAGIDSWPMELNVGALGGKPGAKQLDSTTYLLDTEISALEALTGMGVNIYFQIVPNSARHEWKSLRSKFIKS